MPEISNVLIIKGSAAFLHPVELCIFGVWFSFKEIYSKWHFRAIGQDDSLSKETANRRKFTLSLVDRQCCISCSLYFVVAITYTSP